MKHTCENQKGMAGRDQMALLLRNDGVPVAVGTVGARVRERGVPAAWIRAWKKTTDQDKDARTAHIRHDMLDENGVRNFDSAIPGTRLV